MARMRFNATRFISIAALQSIAASSNKAAVLSPRRQGRGQVGDVGGGENRVSS
jgi:hypothetical protein